MSAWYKGTFSCCKCVSSACSNAHCCMRELGNISKQVYPIYFKPAYANEHNRVLARIQLSAPLQSLPPPFQKKFDESKSFTPRGYDLPTQRSTRDDQFYCTPNANLLQSGLECSHLPSTLTRRERISQRSSLERSIQNYSTGRSTQRSPQIKR